SITPAIMAEVAEIYAHRGLHVAARSILLGALRAAGAMNGILLNQLAEVALRMTELEIAFEALNIPVTEHFVAKRRVENLSRLAAAYAKRDDKPRALNVLRSAVGI